MAYRYRGLGATTSDLIRASARSYGIPPAIAIAVAQHESGLNQSAVGKKGELGVFQLMPPTAAALNVDPSNLDQNIDGGVRYLRDMYAQFGDWKLALEAYNAGPGRVQRGTVPAVSVSYADSILLASGGVPGPDLPSTDVVGGPTIDFQGPGNGEGAGLSGTTVLALTVAVLAGLWVAGD